MQGMLCHPCIDHPELCHSGHFSTELHDFIPDSSTEGNSDISHYNGVKVRIPVNTRWWPLNTKQAIIVNDSLRPRNGVLDLLEFVPAFNESFTLTI